MFEKVNLIGKYQLENGTTILFVWGEIPYEIGDPRWVGLGIRIQWSGVKATVKACYWIHSSKHCAKCLIEHNPNKVESNTPPPPSSFSRRMIIEKEVKYATKHISTSNRLATENVITIYISKELKHKLPWEGAPTPSNLRDWIYDNYPNATQAVITNRNKIISTWRPTLKLR